MNRSLRTWIILRHGSLLAVAGLALACSSSAPHSAQAAAGAAGVPSGAGQGNPGTGGAGGAFSNPGGGSSGTVNVAGDNGGASTGGTPPAGGGTSAGGASGGAAGAAPVTSGSFPQLAKGYSGVFSAPPKLSDTSQTTDAPLLGNGDLGVSMQNNIDTLTFILHKNEFWSLSQGHVEAMAHMSLAIPGMAGATYAVKQDIGTAELNGSFVAGGNTLTTKSWVQADDTTHNLFITEFTYKGTGSQAVSLTLAPGGGNTNPSAVGVMDDMLYIDVRGDTPDRVGAVDTHRVRVATRLVGAKGTATGNKLSFTLAAGQSYSLVSSVMSFEDDNAYQQKALSAVSALAQPDVDSLLSKHHAWWDAFYAK
ncbi:MAG TPA: hypothetical protein VGL19_01795, partial [Polyangiaceae bacterium]